MPNPKDDKNRGRTGPAGDMDLEKLKAKAKAAKPKVIATHKVEGNQTLSHIALKY
jgi:hypothetical protein